MAISEETPRLHRGSRCSHLVQYRDSRFVTAEVAEKKPRKPLTVGGHAVGRRKQAIARVRLVPGSRVPTRSTVAPLEQYFPNKLHQQLINDPFTVLELGGSYDVIARITGGGPSGQAGALRLGIARALEPD